MRDARSYGAVVPPRVDVDFHAAMERVLRLRARLSRATSPRMLRGAGIDRFFGHALFKSPGHLDLDCVRLGSDNAPVARGAGPDAPDHTCARHVVHLPDDTLIGIENIPSRL